MTLFVGSEFINDKEIEPTGVKYYFHAQTIEEAVKKALYTARLTNGNAFIGPTGRVIHNANKCVVITRDKCLPLISEIESPTLSNS